ncbi:MAG: triose-phosphate isomerase [Oscillospiraceae bacterium]
MNKQKRDVVITGNWKMNKTVSETAELLSMMKGMVADADCRVALCLPAINIPCAVECTAGSNIAIGAQNCHWAKSGAFTGELSADMLNAFGVEYAIIGHSERRQYFGETDETVNLRAKACLENGISPIICVGENLEQREKGITKDVIKAQITKDLEGLTVDELKRTIIAYEPIWAIGTGKTATAQQAQDVCGYIRELVSEMFSQDCAELITIQYGGSMNAANASELLAMPDIDGGLIGGASLKPTDFARIIAAAN